MISWGTAGADVGGSGVASGGQFAATLHGCADIVHHFLQCLRDRFAAFFFRLGSSNLGLIEQSRVSPAHDFRHAGEIILPSDGLDFEAAIVRAVGRPFLKRTIEATA